MRRADTSGVSKARINLPEVILPHLPSLQFGFMRAVFDEFTFDSDFDSGNLAKVEEVSPKKQKPLPIMTKTSSQTSMNGSSSRRSSSPSPQIRRLRRSSLPSSSSDKSKTFPNEYVFQLWTRPDGYGIIEPPSKNRSWFHFSVTFHPDSQRKHDNGQTVSVGFRIMNLNKVSKLFSAGMRPFFRSEKDTKWRPLSCTPVTTSTDDGLQVYFQFAFSTAKVRIPASGSSIPSFRTLSLNENRALQSVGTKMMPASSGTYFFCYAIPYSFEKLQQRLTKLDNQFSKSGWGPSRLPRPILSSARTFRVRAEVSSDIYYHRDVLIDSWDGHPVDILTISSMDGLLPEYEPSIDGLFPEKYKTIRPQKFRMQGNSSTETSYSHSPGKSFFFVSARVHPGEAVASYMLDGFLEFILSSDPQANLLRSLFVIKVIPMLNPDGVIRGNYRCDTRGVNLNRMYHSPDKHLHPTIWATTKYITEGLLPLGELKWYFDFHGHANKWGCFFLGNWIPNVSKQLEMMKFTRYMYLRCGTFDFSECDYTPKGMIHPELETAPAKSNMSIEDMEKASEKTKDGTGRVTVFRASRATHCYTFEANYYGMKSQRRIPVRSTKESETQPSMSSDLSFTIEDLKDMGRSLGLAVYDAEVSQRPYLSLSTLERNSETVAWSISKIKRMYEKAQVPFDASQLLMYTTKSAGQTSIDR